MAFNASVFHKDNAVSALESWSAGLDLTEAAKSFYGSTPNGSLEHLNVGGQNFADALAEKSGIDRVTIENVRQAVDRFMIDNGCIDTAAAKIATENLSISVANKGIEQHYLRKPLDDIDRGTVADLACECLKGFPAAVIASTVKEIGTALSAVDPRMIATESLREQPANGLSTYDAVGPAAYGHYANPDIATDSINLAVESFGATINALNVNTRLSILVSILRNFNSTIDKIFVRVPDETNTVILTIPSPSVFNLENQNNQKSGVRNSPEAFVSLINVHAEPGIVNTAPQEVMPNINPVMDEGIEMLDTTSIPGQIAIKANGQDANLFDLCTNTNRYGYENHNHTDSIAEGGDVRYIVLKGTKAATDGKSAPVVEYYTQTVAGLPSARYIATANNIDSGDTLASIQDLPFTITATSLTNDGKTTSLFSGLGKANISLRVNFTSSLRLKFGDINASGGVKVTVIPAGGISDEAASSDIKNATDNILNGVTFEICSFVPKLFFNEENLRKTVTAVRVDWFQRSFQIPQGKTFTNDTALDQERDNAAVEAIQTAMSIGNSDRGMAVCASRMDEMADLIETARDNPEIYRRNRIQNLSYAATLCRPYVLRATADYKQLNVSVMRESERLSDKHAKMVQILLNTLTNVTTRSLYNVSIQPGEKVVFKALMHQVSADLLFNIPSYHPTLSDVAPKANGSDYSFTLPNGYRIDVVKTNFHDWTNKILIMPVKEDDPASILSFASIRDRGVFSGTIPGINYVGATSVRDIVNSREFVLVTNPIGVSLTVENIDVDLGGVDIIDAI